MDHAGRFYSMLQSGADHYRDKMIPYFFGSFYRTPFFAILTKYLEAKPLVYEILFSHRYQLFSKQKVHRSNKHLTFTL